MPTSSWASVDLAKVLGKKFERQWHNLSAERRQAWARLSLTAVLAVVLALYASIALLRATSRGANNYSWEVDTLRAIESAPIGFSSAVWLQTFGSDFMLGFVVLTGAALAIWNNRPLLAVSIVMSLIVMDAIVRIGWFSFERHRPAVIAQGLASPGFHSFPSGHTSKTIAVYGLLAAQWFRASRNGLEKLVIVVLATGIALVVPYGRVRMGVHWPTDVMGGYLLGAVWLAFMVAAVRHDEAS